MKYLLIILTILLISCDMTEPEVEETISLQWIYSSEGSTIHTPLSITDTITINGSSVTCWKCDWIKATVKGDKLVNYEYYRYGKLYFKEPNVKWKYTWRKK